MSIKKAVVILLIIAVIGVIIVAFALSKKPAVDYTTVRVENGNIVQTVSETGTVKSADEIDLHFLNTGKIAKINYKIGDTVKKGAVLAELDYSDLDTKKRELSANVDVARENLSKLISGATAEEIAVAKANSQQAQTAYESAVKELDKISAASAEAVSQARKKLSDLESADPSNITATEQAVASAQTTLNNTIATYQNSIDNSKATGLATARDKISSANNALDAVNRVVTDEDGKDQLSRREPSYLSQTQATYTVAAVLIQTANTILAQAIANDDQDDILAALGEVVVLLQKTFECLNNCYSALENTVTTTTFTQSELDAFKTSISAQQTAIAAALAASQAASQNLNNAILGYETNVSAAESALVAARAAYNDAVQSARNALATAELSTEQTLTSAEAKVNSSKDAWSVMQAQYNRTIAPVDEHDLALGRAKVRQAEATLESVNKQIENSIILAAIDGTITKVNYEVGEQVSMAGGPVISMLGSNNFQIEVLISEADIAKLEVSDKVKIDLDAFGEDVVFGGTVYFIEPAETIIQDVIYYKVDVEFDPREYPVKSGMTANVIITTAEKQNVLTVPSRAVIDRNGDGKIVRVLANSQLLERPVTVGLRGDEGLVEVLSGLSAGDEVVTYVNNNQ